MPVGEFVGDQAVPGAVGLGGGDGARGGGDLDGEVLGAVAFGGGAGGEGVGEAAGSAFGGAVGLADGLAGGGGLGDALQQVQRAGGEVAFGGEFGAAAELGGEAVHEVGEAVGVPGVGDGAQQEVGEVAVVLDREEAGRLALVGVHLALVAEEFGVEAEFAEVLGPAVVAVLEDQVEVGVGLARLGEGVAEALHGAAAAAGLLVAGQADPFGDRQRVEGQAGAGAEGVPGLGELARVGGDLAAAPLADLADHDQLARDGVLPLQGDVAAVVGEQELAQHAGAGAAEGVAVAGEHDREDQLEQDRLAAAVLQEEHAGGGGAADRAVGVLAEQADLLRGRVGDRLADAAQVEHRVGVAGAGRSDRVEADPVELVHVRRFSVACVA